MAYRGFSGGGFVGNHLTTALLEQLRPAADNAGRHATVGDPSTRAAPYTSDGESWKSVPLVSADGTSLVSGGGTEFPILTSNDGTRDILRLPSNSWLQLGVASQGSGKELVNITRLDTNADAVSRPVMVYMDHAFNPAAAPGSTTDFHALDVKTYGSSANINANTRFYCVEGKANLQKTSGTALRGVGVMGSVVNSGAGGTLTLGVGVQTDVQNTSSGTMTEGVGLYVPSGVSSGGGAITTLYGVKVEDQAAGTANYAIQTKAGAVQFFSGTAVPAGGTAGVGVTMSSTANLGVFFGSGVPTLSAAQGSLYMRTDGSTTSTRMYVNTNGTTGWTAVTTAT